MRTTAQRVGDVVLVLCLVSALTFAAVLWSSYDGSDGFGKSFWLFGSTGASGASIFAFAGAAAFNWMDNERRLYGEWALVVLLAVFALFIVVGTIVGHDLYDNDSPGQAAAFYLQQAAVLILALGGLAIVKGVVPFHLPPANGERDG